MVERVETEGSLKSEQSLGRIYVMQVFKGNHEFSLSVSHTKHTGL